MIPLLIGVFLIILFIVVVVLSASTWRGWHIAAACLTFLSAVVFVIVASMSQKTHVTWKSQHAKVQTQLAGERVLGIKLEIGDPTLPEPDEPSLLQVQQRFSDLTLDRGRVWRRCSPASPPQGNRIMLSTVPVTEEGTPGDPTTAAENGIQANMVLHAFREGELATPEGGKLWVPVAYLGEFMVVEAQPASVMLEPTVPLDGQQRMLMNDTSATWAIYEMMPLDAHRIYAKTDTLGRSLDNTIDQPIFGEMDEQEIRSMFMGVTGLPAESPLLEAMVAPYLKDGYAASDQDVNAFPTNVWMKLEFEQAHKERVDSNSPDPGIAGVFFDAEGYAVVSRLRAGEEVTFQVNDIGVFPYAHEQDRQAVDQLVANGICRKIGPIYVRSLRDYEHALHDIQERFVKRNEDIARVKRDIENLNTSIRITQAQIAYRQEERQKLKEDQVGFARDNEKMDQLVATLQNQKTSLQEELSALYRTNLALSQQLEIYSAMLTEEINRRAADVAVK